MIRHPEEGDPVMTGKRLFLLNAVIAGGYGIVLLLAAGPVLDVYGIDPNPEGVYMARWFGLELLGIGLVTWLARDAAESTGGQAIARALAVTYTIGVALVAAMVAGLGDHRRHRGGVRQHPRLPGGDAVRPGVRDRYRVAAGADRLGGGRVRHPRASTRGAGHRDVPAHRLTDHPALPDRRFGMARIYSAWIHCERGCWGMVASARSRRWLASARRPSARCL
jgi:hypothetical protein